MVQSMERPYVDLTGGQLSTGKQKKTITTTTATTIIQQQKRKNGVTTEFSKNKPKRNMICVGV